MPYRRLAVALIAVIALLFAATASAKPPAGPRLTVSKADLAAAFHCPRPVENATDTPIMLVTGTGASGEQAYLIGEGAFEAYGHPVCYVDFPDFTTADIQVSVQYLVYGLRREAALSGRKVAVFGISQGGLLPRFALTYWPDLRSKVSDVLAAAGTQHGSNVGKVSGNPCSAANPCTPAGWQQQKGSNLLNALNSQPDETPGNVSYTTVRSLTDETVQPQGGKHPTSALDGSLQHPDPGRLPGPHNDPYRHRARLGHLRSLRRRDRPQGRRQGLAPAERRVLAPVRAGARRGDRGGVAQRGGRAHLESERGGAEADGRAEGEALREAAALAGLFRR